MRDVAIHFVEEVRAGRMTRRDLVRRASVVGFSMSSISGLLAACDFKDADDTTADSPDRSGPVRRGGTATFGMLEPTAEVEPYTMSSNGAIQTAHIVGECLAFPRPDFTLAPKLATRWEAGETPKEWTFYLRNGVTFHSGAPLTAADVVTTFDRLTDPESNSAAFSDFEGILSNGNTEAVDSHTVRFHLDRPFVDFPVLVSAFSHNVIILPKDYEPGQFAQGGVGTGPFILRRLTQQGAELVRNPDYWDRKLPYLDEIRTRYYADPAAMVLALQANEVDTIQAPYQGSQALMNNPDFRALSNPSSAYRAVNMRVDRDPFRDKRVRQAVALCLDRQGLIDSLFEGTAVLGNDHGFAEIFPSSPDPARIPARKQDHEAAKQLLAEAGHPNGVRLTVTTKRFLELADYAVILKEHCRPAGIEIEVNVQTPEVFDGSEDRQPWLEVPMGIVPWGARGVPSQLIAPAYTCGGVWNSAKWCNEEYDKLIADIDAELDVQRRKELAVEAAQIQHEDVPAVIAYWAPDMRFTRARVNGLAGGPNPVVDASRMWVAA